MIVFVWRIDMARGRMLNKVIGVSVKFASLKDDTARLLATWTIAHLDKRGVFYGDPDTVKGYVAPMLAHLTHERVTDILADMERVGLIERFTAGGRVWQVWPGFDHNQPYLRGEREASDFPDPAGVDRATAGLNPSIDGLNRAAAGFTPAEVNTREVQDKGIEGNGSANAPPVGPIPFSEPDSMTRAARAAGIGSQPSPRSAAAKKKAAAQFDIGVLEDAPAIKVHRDVCGYVPMTPEQAREIVAGVNGDAETGWRDNLTFWMAQGYRADNFDGQTRRHLEQGKRTQARAKQPAAAKVGGWQPAKGMSPQVPDRTPEQMAEIHRQDLERTKARKSVPDTVTIVDGVEVPF